MECVTNKKMIQIAKLVICMSSVQICNFAVRTRPIIASTIIFFDQVKRLTTQGINLFLSVFVGRLALQSKMTTATVIAQGT